MGPLFLSIDGLFPVKNCGGHFMRHVKYKLPVWDNVCFTPQGGNALKELVAHQRFNSLDIYMIFKGLIFIFFRVTPNVTPCVRMSGRFARIEM